MANYKIFIDSSYGSSPIRCQAIAWSNGICRLQNYGHLLGLNMLIGISIIMAANHIESYSHDEKHTRANTWHMYIDLKLYFTAFYS